MVRVRLYLDVQAIVREQVSRGVAISRVTPECGGIREADGLAVDGRHELVSGESVVRHVGVARSVER